MFISIDPGYKTGICVLQTQNNEIHPKLFTIEGANIEALEFCTNFNEISIVIERMPKVMSMEMTKIVLELDKNLFEMFSDSIESLVRISPSEWKPLSKARNWKCKAGIHERDAYNMIRYYLYTISYIDLGDYIG